MWLEDVPKKLLLLACLWGHCLLLVCVCVCVCVRACIRVCAREACARGQSAHVNKSWSKVPEEKVKAFFFFNRLKVVSLVCILLDTRPSAPTPVTFRLYSKSYSATWCVVSAGEASISDWPVRQLGVGLSIGTSRFVSDSEGYNAMMKRLSMHQKFSFLYMIYFVLTAWLLATFKT